MLSSSSAKALAVMAMIGTSAASGRWSARMALAAAMPSMTGIIISISMASKYPVEEAEKTSTASLPFSADVTLAPPSSKSERAISRLRALSSTTRTFMPDISSGAEASPQAGTEGSAISKVRVTVKVVPTFGVLSTSMVPPMARTRP